MSPVNEIRILLTRELLKSFRSVKGILLLIFTALGGGGAAVLLAQSQSVRTKRLADKNISPEAFLEGKKEVLGWWFTDQQTGDHVANAPTVLMALFAMSLWMIPAVVLILGFDAVAGERQHRAVRYWTLRTRRWSYITGKFAGLWATCSLVALAMHAIIWIICIARNEAGFGETIAWGLRFWLASLPIIAIWCAVSIFVSSLFRTPILALLLTGGAFFSWWLVYLPFWLGSHLDQDPNGVSIVPEPRAILYVFPNFYDRFLLSPNIGAVLTGLAVCLGISCAFIGGTSAIFAKRDV